MWTETCDRWMVVVGAFISYFLAEGCTYSAGILFYEFKDIFHASYTATILLPALIYALPQFMAPFICPITDTVGYSTAATWGGLVLCLSFVVTSFAQKIGLAYFSYGVVMSLGLQLTYTSAFMAVVSNFKDHRWLGLACGIMVCGGGIGSFATNHLLAWILSSWTWREALVIMGAIFLHAWVSASLFYSSDEQAIIKNKSKKYAKLLEQQVVNGTPSKENLVEISKSSVSISSKDTSNCRRFVNRLKRLWFFCPIIMLLAPANQRPRAHKNIDFDVAPTKPLSERTLNFFHRLRESLSHLLSPGIWKNSTFLIYTFTNGMANAGVVIPWTIAYAYVQHMWLAGVDSNTDSVVLSATQTAWYPALIGLGSCGGQMLFGLIISKLHNPSAQLDGVTPPSHPFRKSRLFYIFAVVLILNGAATLGFTYAPLHSFLESGGEEDILSTANGRMFAGVCFLLGVTDGAFMTLLGPMLEHLLDEDTFPAGLGVNLCTTGAFNFIGTLTAGQIVDVFGSYYGANLLAAGLPFGAFLILLLFILSSEIRLKTQIKHDASSGVDDSSIL